MSPSKFPMNIAIGQVLPPSYLLVHTNLAFLLGLLYMVYTVHAKFDFERCPWGLYATDTFTELLVI